MKITLLVLLFIIVTPIEAKFASWAFDIPCTGIELKVTSCEEKSFSNLSFMKKAALLRKKKQEIILKGAVVKGSIIKTAPVSCRAKQKLDISRYKEANYKGKEFLILGKSCSKISRESLKIRATKSFCDTPGALEIRDCFYNQFQYKMKMIIAEAIDKL